MVIAAIVVFAGLLTAWLLAPAEPTVVSEPVLPLAEGIAEAA